MEIETALNIVKWPVVVVLIVLIFSLSFRGAITRVIDRTKRASFGGAHIETPIEQQPEKQTANTIASSTSSPVTPSHQRLPPTEVIYAKLEEEGRSIVESSATDDASKVAWAIRLAATMATERNFETAFRQIFGSQLRLLREANIAGGEITRTRSRELYDQAAETVPDFYAGYSFEKWVQWLINGGFIESVVGGSSSRFRLTRLGHAFLVYSTRVGLPEGSKPG